MKPGPATSALATPSTAARPSASSVAMARGFWPSGFAMRIAMLDAQSPCSRSLGRSRVTSPSASPSSTSAPAARRRSTSASTRSYRARARSAGVTPKSYPARLVRFVTCRARSTPPERPPSAPCSSPRHPFCSSPDAPGPCPGRPTRPPRRPLPSRPRPRRASPPRPKRSPFRSRSRCDELLSADDVYAFNPNYGTDPGFEPSAEAVVGIVDEAGTACGLLNQTNGAVIEFGVATPPAGALEARMGDAALNSNVVPTYGTPPDVEGYFTRTGDVGEAQVFTGPYWVVIDSTELIEPGDAQSIVSALLANLPAG